MTLRVVATFFLPLALAACGRAEDTAWSGYAEADYVYVAAPLRPGQPLDVRRAAGV